MTESIEITRNLIRAGDTASCKLVLNGIFILREHFEAQTVVQIHWRAAERGGPVRRGGEPGLIRDDAGRAGWGRFPVRGVRGGKLKNWKYEKLSPQLPAL